MHISVLLFPKFPWNRGRIVQFGTSEQNQDNFAVVFLGDLVLVVVVDSVVPAIRLSVTIVTDSPTCVGLPCPRQQLSGGRGGSGTLSSLQQGLVTVSPLKVLGADVLVGVFGALLQRRHMAPVFPMVLPQNPGVDAGCNQEDGDTATKLLLACDTCLDRREKHLVQPRFVVGLSRHVINASSRSGFLALARDDRDNDSGQSVDNSANFLSPRLGEATY